MTTQGEHADRAHAKLGASSAHRWLHCTKSANLEAELPDSTSSFAQEGTLAHEIAEQKLQYELKKISKVKLNGFINKKKRDHQDVATASFLSSVDDYVAQVMEFLAMYGEGASLELEQRVDFSDWVPGGFGTADAVIISEPFLHIVDLKFGKGVPVDAANNEQLMLYALGAYADYGNIYSFDIIRMSIIQPRLDNTSTFEMSVEELLQWAYEVVEPAAALAEAGEGTFEPSDKACRFCKLAPSCKARAEQQLTLIQEDFANFEYVEAAEMSIAELAEHLPRIQAFIKWARDVETYLLDQAVAGETVPGYKVVEGRSLRKITDDSQAQELLSEAGFQPDEYAPRKLLTLTGLEKLAGKKRLSELLDDVIVKPDGKPTLVPESDKRPPMQLSDADVDAFDDVA